MVQLVISWGVCWSLAGDRPRSSLVNTSAGPPSALWGPKRGRLGPLAREVGKEGARMSTRARGAKLRTVLGVIVSCGINGAGGENHKA